MIDPVFVRVLLRPLIALLIVLSANAAQADGTIAKGALADWVELIELPQANAARSDHVRNGLSYLLSEYQVQRRDYGWDVFERNAYQVVHRTGLDAGARISIDFDPATHDVTLGRLDVIRDGKVIDKLASTTFEIVRREQNAERGIFDGWLTAYVNVGDVRVGDIVDYSTMTKRTPIADLAFFRHRFSAAWAVPVALIREKITWPADHPLSIASDRTSVSPRIETRGNDTTYFWEIADPDPVKAEANLPADHSSYPWIEVSALSSWSTLADALRPHYRLDQELTPDWQAQVDRIAADYPRPQDRLVEAMRMVQDELRYVSLAMGSGSYIPRPMTTVLESGFGDCKDKALLLAIILRKLGIEADVALTDSDQGAGLDKGLPGIGRFDHVIVRARLGGTYWLDATDYLVGGRADNLTPPDFHFALPLVEGPTALEAIRPRPVVVPSTSVEEEFTFPARTGDPLTLKVTTTYQQRGADRMRYRLKSESRAALADAYLNYYNSRYPGIRSTAPLATFDERDANVVVTVERYELAAEDLARDDLAKKFPIRADIGISDLPKPNGVDRKGPVYLGAPSFKHHKVRVSNLKAKFGGPDNSKPIFAGFATFMPMWTSTDTELTVDWYLYLLADRVPAEQFRTYLKSVNDMSDDSEWTFDFTYEDTKKTP